jgi:hypothetical protein
MGNFYFQLTSLVVDERTMVWKGFVTGRAWEYD